MYIVLFYRYANHVCVSHTTRTNYGDECDLPPTMRTPSIFGKSFLLGGTYRTDILSCHHTFMLHQEANHENQRKLKKIDSDLKSYPENPSNFNTFMFPSSDV
jgi:hypothetical protein